MSTRSVIYCRVSTDAQERDGTSLDTQERACVEFAEANHWTVVGAIRDAASGFTLERPGIDRLREILKRAEADVVLAYAVDRLSRNQNHIGVLFDEANQAGVKLDFVTEKFEDTAVGRFILAARAFVAEVEREKIVERTLRGKAHRAKQGKLPQATGRGIYGYTYLPATGTREVNEVQAAVVRRVFETFVNGGSCHSMASKLNGENVPAFSGGQWYPLTIRRLLLNETYTGRTIFRRMKVERFRDGKTGRWRRRPIERDSAEWIEVEGATPPIIPRDLFLKAQAIFQDPDRRNKSRPSRAYPLRGRIRCAFCGSPMVGQSLMKGRYSYYRCRHSYGSQWERQCSSKYISSEVLERAVRQALADLLADPERILSEARRLANSCPTGAELQSTLQALQDVETCQRRLVRLFTEGNLPHELLEEQSRELSQRRAQLEAERQRLESMKPNLPDFDTIERILPHATRVIRAWVSQAGEDKLDLLLRAVDAHVVASDSQIRIRGFVPVYRAAPNDDLVTIEQTWA